MNQIDLKFALLMNEIRSLSEQELYHQIRLSFEQIPDATRNNMMNFFNQFLYWGSMDIEHNNFEEIELKVHELKEHVDDFEELYINLEDYRSKKLLYAILNNWVHYDFNTLSEVIEKCYDDYFDLDLIPTCNEEVFVDLGAYTGDSTISFLRNYGDSYKKIYAYEITPETYQILVSNLKDYPNVVCYLKGVGDTRSSLSVVNSSADASANTVFVSDNGTIPMVTLDEDIGEKLTMIKADIEGFEQEALLGAINHIKNDHPKLLISVYHKNEDLWKIPKMIKEIDPAYKFYLRYHGGNVYPTEITLIAI
ncbi:MAG TPA: FkbM family methyltransferase [Candidatus Caccenecus avistercoris]|nr:FkbM family methyltransferase [Candidatus Caccenecus avistercoris]